MKVTRTLLNFSFLSPTDVVQNVASQVSRLPECIRSKARAVGNLERFSHGSLAPASVPMYERAWKVFKDWLTAGFGSPFLANGLVVSLYLADLIGFAENDFRGASEVNLASCAIAYHFHLSGLRSPTESEHCKLLRQTAGRVLTAKKSKCEFLTAFELHTVLKFSLVQCSLRDRMHITVFLLMFLGFLRFSDACKILAHRDFIQFIPRSTRDSSDDGVLLFIPCSKTDQRGDGAWVAIGATNTEFCPVRLLRELLIHGKYTLHHTSCDTGPLLRAVKFDFRSKTHVLSQVTASLSQPISSLSYTSFRQHILLLVAAAGIQKHIGMHAGRIGGSNLAASERVDSKLVCHHGRWSHGNTFDDTYLKMCSLATPIFELTRKLWKF